MTPITSTPALLEQAAVQRHLVHRMADAAQGDDQHARLEQIRDMGIGQVEHRPHAGVSGAFDDDQLMAGGDTCVRLLDGAHQRRDNGLPDHPDTRG